ncbi:hypothetical protein NESM_000531300 [Novymonas esmeraldas]|uniref:Uncharacterized protein n=1 Tax=Novymonas esmeraldas TaxID=1808958 RepID=A0AAW0ESK9_9TRYP
MYSGAPSGNREQSSMALPSVLSAATTDALDDEASLNRSGRYVRPTSMSSSRFVPSSMTSRLTPQSSEQMQLQHARLSNSPATPSLPLSSALAPSLSLLPEPPAAPRQSAEDGRLLSERRTLKSLGDVPAGPRRGVAELPSSWLRQGPRSSVPLSDHYVATGATGSSVLPSSSSSAAASAAIRSPPQLVLSHIPASDYKSCRSSPRGATPARARSGSSGSSSHDHVNATHSSSHYPHSTAEALPPQRVVAHPPPRAASLTRGTPSTLHVVHVPIQPSIVIAVAAAASLRSPIQEGRRTSPAVTAAPRPGATRLAGDSSELQVVSSSTGGGDSVSPRASPAADWGNGVVHVVTPLTAAETRHPRRGRSHSISSGARSLWHLSRGASSKSVTVTPSSAAPAAPVAPAPSPRLEWNDTRRTALWYAPDQHLRDALPAPASRQQDGVIDVDASDAMSTTELEQQRWLHEVGPRRGKMWRRARLLRRIATGYHVCMLVCSTIGLCLVYAEVDKREDVLLMLDSSSSMVRASKNVLRTLWISTLLGFWFLVSYPGLYVVRTRCLHRRCCSGDSADVTSAASTERREVARITSSEDVAGASAPAPAPTPTSTPTLTPTPTPTSTPTPREVTMSAEQRGGASSVHRGVSMKGSTWSWLAAPNTLGRSSGGGGGDGSRGSTVPVVSVSCSSASLDGATPRVASRVDPTAGPPCNIPNPLLLSGCEASDASPPQRHDAEEIGAATASAAVKGEAGPSGGGGDGRAPSSLNLVKVVPISERAVQSSSAQEPRAAVAAPATTESDPARPPAAAAAAAAATATAAAAAAVTTADSCLLTPLNNDHDTGGGDVQTSQERQRHRVMQRNFLHSVSPPDAVGTPVPVPLLFSTTLTPTTTTITIAGDLIESDDRGCLCRFVQRIPWYHIIKYFTRVMYALLCLALVLIASTLELSGFVTANFATVRKEDWRRLLSVAYIPEPDSSASSHAAATSPSESAVAAAAAAATYRLCARVQLNGRCSGFETPCTGTFASLQDAYAASCPFCPPDLQARITAAAGTRTCAEQFACVRKKYVAVFALLFVLSILFGVGSTLLMVLAHVAAAWHHNDWDSELWQR